MKENNSIEFDYKINDIDSIISNFKYYKNPIELYPLSFLQSRYEKKYIISQNQFRQLMNNKKIQYKYSLGFSRTFIKYSNQYYDLKNLHLYRIHHNGKKDRHKIRTRSYDGFNKTFELNYKNNRNLIIKNRFPIKDGQDPLLIYAEKINALTKYNPESLYKSLKTEYYRTTFFNRDLPERITVDTNLLFSGEIEKKLSKIFVIELKTNSYSNRSTFSNMLKEMRIHPIPFSKYCTGISLTNSEIKKNNFKQIIYKINKIMEN